MTAEHTPGPFVAYTTDTGIREVHDADGRLLAYVESLEDGIDNKARLAETDANLRLFAAVPELLEACKSVFRIITAAVEHGEQMENGEFLVEVDADWLLRQAATLRAAARAALPLAEPKP